MCTSSPKPPPAPVLPASYNSQPEVIDQAALDTRNRQRRLDVFRNGRQSTILAGKATGGAAPPTSGAKALTGV